MEQLVSVPHLPSSFLDPLLSEPWMSCYPSRVLQKEFQDFRCSCINGKGKISAESRIQGFEGGSAVKLYDGYPSLFTQKTRRDREKDLHTVMEELLRNPKPPQGFYADYSMLHVGIDESDPPLVAEALRLGALREQESKGLTPLLLVMQRLWQLHWYCNWVWRPVPGNAAVIGNREPFVNVYKRLKAIAKILIEQHCDPNKSFIGCVKKPAHLTPLQIALLTEEWDLVALLLVHKANPSPSSPCTPMSHIFEAIATGSQARFSALVANRPANRPLRVCPCFSGLALDQCHSTPKPYPVNHMCPCGKRRVYGQCCHKRDIRYDEVWHEESQWLQISRQVKIPMKPPKIDPETQSILDEHGGFQSIMDKCRAEDPEYFDQRMQDCMEIFKQAMLNSREIDPAFKFACERTKYFPRPLLRSESLDPKKFAAKKQKVWNSLIDDYIALGSDPRPKFDIEIANKISNTFGALYRTCEGENCTRVEKRDVEKLSTCTRCKMSFYCSRTCQASHWKQHKKVCNTSLQAEVPIPSMAIMEQMVEAEQTNSMENLARVTANGLN
ncbi:hypothetical protein C8J56DRAFT_315564 [Mycena floridula]|nr:hypothetical protein C8J56DRAFT_315564 [Mycena floridula]